MSSAQKINSKSGSSPVTIDISDSPPKPSPLASAMPEPEKVTSAEESSPSAAAVLAYLRKRGLGSAAAELSRVLKEESGEPPASAETAPTLASIERDELLERETRTDLSRSTGGGIGNDLDGAATMAMWGEGGLPHSLETKGPAEAEKQWREKRGGFEAVRYTESYAALHSWILSLPDAPGRPTPAFVPFAGEPGDPTGAVAKTVAKIGREMTHVVPPVPTPKHELLGICFPLFVHSYCELLECGLEHDAAAFLQAFAQLHRHHYKDEVLDLQNCSTTARLVEINSAIIQNTALVTEKSRTSRALQILNQRRNDLLAQNQSATSTMGVEDPMKNQNQLVETKNQIAQLEDKLKNTHNQMLQVQTTLSRHPFLKRVRHLKWQIRVGGQAFEILKQVFFRVEVLLPMSLILQSRCQVIVEERDPLCYVPGCVFEDDTPDGSLLNDDIKWAAPIDPRNRACIMGEDDPEGKRVKLPFPNYSSNAEEDEEEQEVAFNRALLIHGFRRLEALEIKREFESGERTLASKTKSDDSDRAFADPCSPSILLSTLLSSKPPATADRQSCLNVTCAALSPPDGRRVAIGASDGAIRVHALDAQRSHPPTILLGHKNGWPVFDLSWCRDGRTLLSAGGDGTIRLWDTLSIGPKCNAVATVQKRSSPLPKSKTETEGGPTHVPIRRTALVEIGGAALCVFRGHAVGTPAWSVRFAPSGYYFLSTGADRTARLWTTDRPLKPARILAGHYAGVNCCAWHPNCNYVLTGADDATLRLWDALSGKCVRILSGLVGNRFRAVQICPSGRFCVAGVEHRVGMWDLGTGRMVRQFAADPPDVVYSLAYSACGTALAVGGLDCKVTVWDVKGAGVNWTVPEFARKNDWKGTYAFGGRRDSDKTEGKEHKKVFKTKQTVILNLMYTKRNLLMGVGKFVGTT